MAPLTSRGRQLVRAIHQRESEFVARGELPNGGGLLVAQEGLVQMVSLSYVRRLPRIHQFQEAMRKAAHDRDGSQPSR